ncbi:uncharacterized protein LOC119069854 [Bradysia coprophila]|uniref:uncharacterized protein LOC119069854 n=1 Tax=Bradysia coprophila TaxID=38358 RepID=UPI00187DCB8F|nr:uncharacterized protein LOC119069854 [Bradysia coprophila]
MYLKNVLVLCGLSSMLAVSSGLMLECNYSRKVQDDIGLVYTCEARVVPVGDQRYVFSISENSVHLEGYGNDDVEALEYNAPIGFTPRNVSSFFPNLLLIKANGIQSDSLTREDLTGFAQLRSLRFSDNNLREIGNDLFIENPLLTLIFLDNNQIRHVANNVFDHLTLLRTLYMFNNDCTNEFVYNEPDKVPDVLFQILLECPPTFEMIEERIVNGDQLGLAVQSRIDSATATLHEKLEAVVEQLSLLEERIELLETNSTIPVSN